jgi:isocitrate/isopropylmalate dehydrogenase
VQLRIVDSLRLGSIGMSTSASSSSSSSAACSSTSHNGTALDVNGKPFEEPLLLVTP